MLLNSEHICMRLCGMQRIFASAKCVRTTLLSIRSRSLYASEDMRLLHCTIITGLSNGVADQKPKRLASGTAHAR